MDWSSGVGGVAFLQEVILPQQDQEKGACLLSQYCSCVSLRRHHWWFKATAMLWNLTPQQLECLHCPSHQASADCRGWRAEALTVTDPRLNLTENALISVWVNVVEPIHSTIQRVATSKSSGTCWTLACLPDSLENKLVNQTGILQGALGTFCWTSLYMRTVNTNPILFNIHKGMMQSLQFFSDLQESVLKAIATKETLNFTAQPSEQAILRTPHLALGETMKSSSLLRHQRLLRIHSPLKCKL